MNKKLTAAFSVLIISIFIGYMIYDTAKPDNLLETTDQTDNTDSPPDSWIVERELKIKEGSLKAIASSPDGNFYTGGDSFVSGYDSSFNLTWSLKTPEPVTALSKNGDIIFAATLDRILLISSIGELTGEWGPFEDNSIITSVTSNNNYVAFADAGNKAIFILDKGGEVKKLIGQNDGQFIVPSPFFDVALNPDNTFYVANTGHRRVEERTSEGGLKTYFGEAGTAPGAFCGCCNPAHFITVPDGFVTAEKGINRIKILNKSGEFVEYVSAKNKFLPSVPLDLASSDGKRIYAANPADSKVYIFKRK